MALIGAPRVLAEVDLYRRLPKIDAAPGLSPVNIGDDYVPAGSKRTSWV